MDERIRGRESPNDEPQENKVSCLTSHGQRTGCERPSSKDRPARCCTIASLADDGRKAGGRGADCDGEGMSLAVGG